MVPTAISQIVEQVFTPFSCVSGMGVYEHQYSGGDDEKHSSGICRWYDGDGIGACRSVVVVFAYCLIRPYLLWRAERCKQPYEETKRELMGRVLQIGMAHHRRYGGIQHHQPD